MAVDSTRTEVTHKSLWREQTPSPESDNFPENVRFDQIVVGAGLTGLITAVLLARSGARVAVVEARQVGSVATGNSTAKLSVLQGIKLQQVRGFNTRAVFDAYVQSQQAGFDWMLRYLEQTGIDYQRREAVTFAATPAQRATVRHEYDVAREAGLPVEWRERVDLPFETFGAVALPDQVQFNPMDVLASLTDDLRALGGIVLSEARVRRIQTRNPAIVTTTQGQLKADKVVLATGIPILDRGLYFAKVEPKRSYVVAYDLPEGAGAEPGMFLSAGDPSRSVRWHEGVLLVGGGGHGVGRQEPGADPYGEIDEWTRSHWPDAMPRNRWSAQDYTTPQHVPFVGYLPRGRHRVLLATGYEKWGMTAAATSALTLAVDILGGDRPDWQRVLRRRPTLPTALAHGIGANARVATWYAKSYIESVRERGQLVPRVPIVVQGQTCELSLTCPHLGATVRWNDAEQTWDCPAHGSRFTDAGVLLEGPAKGNLRVKKVV